MRQTSEPLFVAASSQAYVERAVELAASPAKRAETASRIAAFADGAEHVATDIARTIEQKGRAALSKAAA